MTMFLCLYSGESFEEVELRAVSADEDICREFALKLIAQAPDTGGEEVVEITE